MKFMNRRRLVTLLLLAGLAVGLPGTMAIAQEPPEPPEPQAPPPLEAPRAEPLPAAPEPVDRRAPAEVPAVEREVPDARPARVYVPQEPPAPIVERPSGERPGPRAVWTPGFWEWDADASQFVWVAGRWQAPPAGMTWSPGTWARDDRGWYYVAGRWTRQARRPAIAERRPPWRIDGPPAEHPDDTPPPAPGPDFFYIAGHYAPERAGERLAWVPGFWAAIQPGWDWIPARWIRRADGWDFREGHWVRDPDALVVERVPPRGLRRNRRVVRPRGPVVEEEIIVEGPEPLPPGAMVPGGRYYMIRPPGGPYGPNGVVVPGAVPPFVRRMLDRVLP